MPGSSMRSEEVQEIMGRPPSWIIRTGTTIIAVVVTFLILGAWFIHYPDLVEVPVLFVSATPPVQLAARSNGRLQRLYVHDGDTIANGQVVAILENAAITDDVFHLARIAQALDTTLNLDRTLASLTLPTAVQAGDLQADYANLYQSVNAYKFFLANRYHLEQLTSLRTQITYYQRLNAELTTKSHSLSEQLALERQKDSLNRVLVSQNVIAKLDFNNNHKILLGQQLSSSDNNTSIIQNQLQQSEYQKTVASLENDHKSQQQELLSKIRAAAKVLVGRIATWNQQYVLRTPIAGKITFFKIWTSNQYIKSDDPIFVVSPPLNSQYARATMPAYKAGKVKVRQPVLIKLDEYPFEEFGFLRGRVEKVSEVSLDKNYLVTIRLAGLRTTTGFRVPLRTELSGTAQIVTNERNIIQRIFNQIYGRLMH
jgi:multidrug efflux pump subunit AcrA (membrane-fusion protein)